MVKTIRLWDDRIEIEYNFTGTDGDGNNYRVVTEFLKGIAALPLVFIQRLHSPPPEEHRNESCGVLFFILYVTPQEKPLIAVSPVALLFVLLISLRGAFFSQGEACRETRRRGQARGRTWQAECQRPCRYRPCVGKWARRI